LAAGKAIAAEMRLLASELDALHSQPAFGAAQAPPAGKPRKKP
jgi:hypothetical protein